MLEILSGLFPNVAIYNYSNLTYPGGLWSFTFASKGLHPTKDFDESRVMQSGLKCKYYTPHIHRAAFCLPAFMQENVSEFLKG